jgi:hypothetical protein
MRAGGDVGAEGAAHHLRERFVPHGGDRLGMPQQAGRQPHRRQHGVVRGLGHRVLLLCSVYATHRTA